MIFRDAIQTIPRRLRRPLIVGLILGIIALQLGLLWFSYWVWLHIPAKPGVAMPRAIYPDFRLTINVIMGVLYLFVVSPVPWQWTGDRRTMAPGFRGLPRVIVFNLGYLALHSLQSWPLLHQQFENMRPMLQGYRIYAFFGWTYLFSLTLYTLVGYALALWETRKAEKLEAERQSEEARWTLLKAQMSPHVLLNSLNGLAELVRDDTAAAVKGMRDLAEIYRQLLSLGEAPKVMLSRERNLLERYLAVEQLRLGELLRVEWDWDVSLDDIETMPLLLQPLVENAIKHGVAADPQGGIIRISGRRDAKGLHLVVANTGEAPVARKGTGVGLRNLKSRLEMAYHGKASFDLVKESPWMRAELNLP